MNRQRHENRIIYYSYKPNIVTSLFKILIILLALVISSSAILFKVFEVNHLTWIIITIVCLYFIWYAVGSDSFISIEISNHGVIIKRKLLLRQNPKLIRMEDIICVYFVCGPFALNTPLIVIKYVGNGIIEKVMFPLHTPSIIIRLLNQLSEIGVKSGISKESANYLDLKEKLPIIDPDKY